LQQEDDQYGRVNRILALSYSDLPYHLKPCFLYLGHYPEDWEISKKVLIRLWIAEGFILASLESKEMLMENVGEFYLEELIGRSLVQVARRDYTGRNVKTCRIHDLLRDLCIQKAREEKFLEILQAPLTEWRTSEVAFFVAISERGIDNTPLVKMQIFKILRALNLVRENVGEWHLHHLRYLKLKGLKSRMNRALHWQQRFCSKNIEILKYIMVGKMFLENNELLRLANSQCLGIAFKRLKGAKPILMTLTELHPLGSLYMELVDIVPISLKLETPFEVSLPL
ncbi:hypothetical protein Goklo_005269, partial [Gossypium klotzschianum]|nr:hypothetical protein [Gossypium klotzschianum]